MASASVSVGASVGAFIAARRSARRRRSSRVEGTGGPTRFTRASAVDAPDEWDPTRVPVLDAREVHARLAARTHTKARDTYAAFYSSWTGCITTDPAAMILPIDDHMVHRGHGVFDTAHVCDGRCHLLDRHLARFHRSMAAAKIKPDISIQHMRSIILRTIAVSGLRDAQVRYYAGAGPGGFALSHDECVEPTFYVMVINGRAAPDPSKGVSVVTSAVPIKPASFATVKSVNYLPNAMVVADAHERGADYGVWITERGLVGEGPSMNLAIIEDGVLLTPPADDILEGCTVRRAMELITECGVLSHLGVTDARYEDVEIDRAKAADEVMLIGSVIWCQPIVAWDGEDVGVSVKGGAGSCALAMHEALLADFRDDASELLVAVPYECDES